MSATNRGAERAEGDLYRTPHWAVAAILERIKPLGSILDAGAGCGDLALAAKAAGYPGRWFAVEQNPKLVKDLRHSRLYEHVWESDFLDRDGPLKELAGFRLVLGNPPYLLAREFVDRARELAPEVVFLLRLNFLESQGRLNWFRSHMPNVYVLSRRPDFTGEGGDATAYGWFQWSRWSSGQMEIL